MDVSLIQQQSKRLLLQRNVSIVAAALAGLGLVVSVIASTSGRREVILVPTLDKQVRVVSGEVSPEYLEMVTRDAALMTLNRGPKNLQYWRDSILKLADPSAYGRLNTELEKVVKAQEGTEISQFFNMSQMTIDPAKMRSTVAGHVSTVVGSKRVASEYRRFRFDWRYDGMKLSLVGFGQIKNADGEEGEE